jgi:anti-sigma-K factor RskA
VSDRPDPHLLTGAYTLDALPPDEREEFEAHLEACATCAEEVARLQACAAWLGSATSFEPPADLRARVLAEIGATEQEPATEHGRTAAQGPTAAASVDPAVTASGEPVVPSAGDPAPPAEVVDLERRRTAPRWLLGLTGAAAAVLLVALAGLALTVNQLTDRLGEVEVNAERALQDAERTSSEVAEVLAAPDATIVSSDDGAAVARVVASPSRGEAVFVADGLESAPRDRTYELWVIDEERAVPAGLFDPDEDGRVTRVMTGDMANAQAIGVTVEPAGGSPEPTSEPIMVMEFES